MRSTRKRQRGVGLIEVLISITLGLLILVALLKSYDDSKATFRVQDSISRLQENARYALYLIGRDLRMAGYRGCARDGSLAPINNTLNTPSAFLYDFQTPVQGFEGNSGGTWSPALPSGFGAVVTGTDVVVVRGVLDDGVVIRQEMPNTSADLKITDNLSPPPVANGDIVMVSDCLGSAIFQITNYTVSNGNIVHQTGTGTPGNATQDLGRRYPIGSQLFKVATISYFVRNSGSGSGPSLWRRVGSDPAQELVEGVQNLQVQYGEDTDGDLMPDIYRNANQVGSFRNVVSIRIALLFRSLERAGFDVDTRTFNLLGTTVGPFSDGRMYQAVTTTLTLRNKAQ
ncbi:MAG TPA: PilW family protein [Nevskiales bacterium]|nr:PilW family protein [Nevskiales bacterium]